MRVVLAEFTDVLANERSSSLAARWRQLPVSITRA
jgi:hypothetical protein